MLRQTLSKARFAFNQTRCFSVAYKASVTEVKKLRDMTGSPLGDCVKALAESTGDFDKAKEFLRKKGLAYAEKRADRLATQGLIGLKVEENLVSMI
jgi:elongation factor Ts